jgi:hypothetical protein
MKLISTLFVALATSSAYSQYKEQSYPQFPVDLGYGWRSMSDMPADASCVDFEINAPTSQVQDVEISSIRTSLSLFAKTRTSLDATVKKITGISAGMKVTFETESSSIFDEGRYFVSATVDNAVQSVKAPTGGVLKIKAEYLDLLNGANGLAAFSAYCGDYFVFARQGGVELLGLSSENKLTREVKQNAKVKWDANLIKVSLDGEINSEQNRKTVEDSLSFRYTLKGGNAVEGATSKEGLENLIRNLASAATPDAQRFRVITLRSYTSLPNWPGSAEVNPSKDLFSYAVFEFLTLRDMQTYIDTAIRNRNRYVDFTYSKRNLIAVDSLARRRIAELVSYLRNCNQLLNTCSLSLGSFDIYSLLALMPLKVKSTEAEVRFSMLSDKFEQLSQKTYLLGQQIASAWQPPPSCQAFPPGSPMPISGSGVGVPVPGGPPKSIHDAFNQYAAYCQELNPIISELSKIPREKLAREAVFDIFVRDVNSEVCRTVANPLACLNQAQIEERSISANTRLMKECFGLEMRLESLDVSPAIDEVISKMIASQKQAILEEAKMLAQKSRNICVGQFPG